MRDTAPRMRTFHLSPDYNEVSYRFSPGLADVGVVIFDDPIGINNYAVVSSPKVGCNYYMVGYGSNDKGTTLERSGTDVCINNITDYSFELIFSGRSHFCQGDSGSGIYERGTNNLVGVVSAYLHTPTETTCDMGLAYIVTRVDDNIDFLKRHIPAGSFNLSTPETTVPNDYLEDYYPETRNDDGSYNYDNEIKALIDGLALEFEEIYPEKPRNKPGTPSPEAYLDDIDDYTYDDDSSTVPMSYADDGETSYGGLVVLMFTCLCCVSLLGLLGILAYFMMRKK